MKGRIKEAAGVLVGDSRLKQEGKADQLAGKVKDDPGRSDFYTVPGGIPPGGRLPFTYRPDTPLPERSDGWFQTSVPVVNLEQID